MIVEFIGCSGSGKSTAARGVYSILRSKDLPVIDALAYLLCAPLINFLRNERLQILVLDLRIISYCLGAFRKHRHLCDICWRYWREGGTRFVRSLMLLRSVLRKLALQEIFSHPRFHPTIVLLDEGPLNIPQVVFSNVKHPIPDELLAEIIALLPLPDIAIHLNPAREVLMRRVIERSDRPVLFASDESLRLFIERSLQVFAAMENAGVFTRLLSYQQRREASPEIEEIADGVLSSTDKVRSYA